MRTFAGILVVILIATVVALPATSPIHLSYVYSESMEPTIDKGDGYIVVPAGVPQPGDIVVFRSAKYDEYVTHRLVGRSEAGYITQGDNNPTSDQATGHPHVQQSDILGTVLTIHGRPVIIPNLRNVVNVVRDHVTALVSILAVFGLGAFLRTQGEAQKPSRSLIRADDIMHPLFVAGLLIVTCLVLFGAGSTSLTYVAIDGSSPAPYVMTVGEPHTDHLVVPTSSTRLSYQAVQTNGMTVTNSTLNGSKTELDVAIPAQFETGPHRATVSIYEYPAVLPRGVVIGLHEVHPVLAATVTSGFSLTVLYGVYVFLFDGQAPLRPSRKRWLRQLRGK